MLRVGDCHVDGAELTRDYCDSPVYAAQAYIAGETGPWNDVVQKLDKYHSISPLMTKGWTIKWIYLDVSDPPHLQKDVFFLEARRLKHVLTGRACRGLWIHARSTVPEPGPQDIKTKVLLRKFPIYTLSGLSKIHDYCLSYYHHQPVSGNRRAVTLCRSVNYTPCPLINHNNYLPKP